MNYFSSDQHATDPLEKPKLIEHLENPETYPIQIISTENDFTLRESIKP